MKKTNRIGRRIILVFLLFGTTLALTLGLSLVVALKSIEINILDDILHAELKHFQQQVKTARQLGLFHSRTTIIYVTPLNEISSLPGHVRDLSPGTHEVTYDNQDYRVLIEHIGDTRYTVQFNDTSIHQRERDFIQMIWWCSIATLVIALVIGWKLAQQVIRPITQLSNQIATIRNRKKGVLDLSEFDDDEIGNLAQELERYHNQLQSLLTREKEFACNVSHELRTPVTNISLAAELMTTKPGLSTVEQERIHRIQRAVGEMSELIETFLVLAQINDESIKSHYTFEMAPIIRQVIEQQRIWLGSKPIEVKFEEKGQLRLSAPSGVLSVLVANLVRNAFRYTERGTVLISLTSNQLTVMDTGVGMDLPTQRKIFKLYTKNSSSGMERIVLGLAIVQRICERYGWTVSFESTKGRGSKFTISFAST